MNPMTDYINHCIAMVETQLKDPKADKVAARRTRAALETAKYCALGIFPSVSQTPAVGPVNGSNIIRPRPDGCICPFGAIDRNCPAQHSV